MEYLFIFDKESEGWWLKIDSVEELANYHAKVSSNPFAGAMEMYLKQGHPYDILDKLDIKERIEMQMNPDFKRLQMMVMQAEKNNSTILDGVILSRLEIGEGQLRTLNEFGSIFINCVGGYTFGLEFDQFVRRREFVFPNFKESDIRIKRFEGGQHFYAYIGDMQVRAGENLKWDSHNEAYEAAVALIE